ncbi:asparagine synthase (glutamine-hydrolyzing) [Aureibaculum sp. 2210JD6-5]|uniref:asparagine synthase (glutamine-hydrolyzing) n=1 Tax=Aureibaculum sp. 2210JD6-5 TaxID=3103957 RepID=UPI002AAE0048|nr:asparagine synthase (glutamine-hydrolyzing) [Aureibaculum sp. 2210JD6-5]MDY7394419.1 asparagine synthase (glutamine-hydrolyzing) [Aureibaculum sp. 2210JD6-5]
MCGIAGIIEFNGESNQVLAIKNMTNSLQNRGPDNEGFLLKSDSTVPYYGSHTNLKIKNKDLPYAPKFHIDTAINKKSNIALGFKRLSIIDLSYNAHQPMSDKSGKYWIIFNGEIYNYKEIRSELRLLGNSFISNSDTEVVLKAYLTWGGEALQKFNGMFAFSILDTVNNEFFLARDRMGIKPLYYFHDNTRFIFSSTIKSIIDSKLYKPEINWNGLSQNYTYSIAQRPNTCFLNITALEPANYIRINLHTGKTTKKKYWNIPIGIQDFSMTEKKAIDLLDESLYNSIKYRLNADVEVGTFMSGGIDSTTISSIASKLQPNIKAFTLGFHNNYFEYDEINQAKDTARINNINHIIHYENPDIVIDNIETIITCYEEPYHHLPANYALSKVVSENHVKVVLNGLGGDELFAGYHFYDKLNGWKILKRFNPIFKLIPKNINKRLDLAKKIASYNAIADFYTHFHSTFNELEKRKLFNNKNLKPINSLENIYPNHRVFTDDIEALSYYNLKSYISNHQTRTIDQFTMNFSIEGRFPFLDHHLIELAFKIPSKYKIKNHSHKYILKEVAKKYIATSCFKMEKKGFGLPLEYWYKSELKDFVQENISLLKKRNFFDNKEIDLIIKTNNVRKIWHLVMTELWIQKFFKPF